MARAVELESQIHVGRTEIAPENRVNLTHSFFPIFNTVYCFIFNVFNRVIFMRLQFHVTIYYTLCGLNLSLAGKDKPLSEIHFPFSSLISKLLR